MSKLNDITLDLEKEFEHLYQIEKLIFNLIKNSEEYKFLEIKTRKITELYIRLLEKYPDKSEFYGYFRIFQEGKSIEEIENLIKNSEEYKSLKINTKEITNLYLKLLERQPDRQGLNDYRNLLKEGKSIEEIENLIKKSKEYKSLKINLSY